MLSLRWLAIGAALLAAVGGGLAVWAARRFRMAVRTRNAFTQTRDLPGPLTGRPAPDFVLPLATGGSTSLAAYRGKPVLLVFWSSF